MSDLRVRKIPPPIRGINIQDDPLVIRDDQAEELINLIPDRMGFLAARAGGMAATGPSFNSFGFPSSGSDIYQPISNYSVPGISLPIKYVAYGTGNNASTAYVDSFLRPFINSSSVSDRGQTAGGYDTYSVEADADNDMDNSSQVPLYPNPALHNNKLYGHRALNDGTVTVGNAGAAFSDAQTTNGMAAGSGEIGLHPLQMLANAGSNIVSFAPDGGLAVASHLNCLFVMGGRDVPGAHLAVCGTTAASTTVQVSVPDGGIAVGTVIDIGTRDNPTSVVSGRTVNSVTVDSNNVITSIVISGGAISTTANTDHIWINGADGKKVNANPVIELNTLYYTNPGAAILDNGATTIHCKAWKTNGVTNKITVGEDTSEEAGMAIVSHKGNLVIFKNKSIWLLQGGSPDEFSVKPLTRDFGLVDQRSIYVIDEQIFFLSQRGFMSFDGSTFAVRSAAVHDKLLVALKVYSTDSSSVNKGSTIYDTANAFAYVTKLNSRNLLIVVGYNALQIAGGTTQSPRTTAFHGVYNLDTGTWTQIQSFLPTGVQDDAPMRDPINVWSPMYAINVTDRTFVSFTYSNPPNTSSSNYKVFWLVFNDFTLNPVDWKPASFVVGRRPMIDYGPRPDVSGTDYDMPVYISWKSKLFQLAEPLQGAQLNRIVVDYQARMLETIDPDAQYIVLDVLDENNNLLTTISLPADQTMKRQRVSVDVFTDLEGIRFHLHDSRDTLAEFQSTKSDMLDEFRLLGVQVVWQPTNRETST